MTRASGVLFCAALPLLAGPVEFGKAELARALAARGLRLTVRAEIVAGASESYRIEPGVVKGGDERGLMYGLLEAAGQIRETGRLSAARGEPQTPMRGIRLFFHNHDLEEDWFYSRDYWDQYLSMLARNRFNRFNLVYAHQTNYLAPPYPFWVEVPEFPSIRVPGLSATRRERNFEMLRYISRTAAEHGIDFTLGVWEHNIQTDMQPTVEGLTGENIGPYSYAALKKVLDACPGIRSVQMRTNSESGIPAARQVEFYRDWVWRAIREANHPVTLDLRGWAMAGGMAEAVQNSRLTFRLSAKYWAEDLGRPYQPAQTYPGYSYLNFLEKPTSGRRPYDFYFELWGLGSHRLLLWGDPQFVRRAVPTFRLSGAVGFEIDPPLAQKGFGNRPGKWGVFTAAQAGRVFWKYEFERYWLFYTLWGRLGYDVSTPASCWEAEMRRRFGPAAADVTDAYRASGPIIGEIVAAHLADPNMYIWPEINPGGLLDDYRDVLPSDWRYVAGIPEAVENRLRGVASAKQTPLDTAAILDGLAQRTEAAIALAEGKLASGNREWLSSQPDFRVLAALARYHALKQRAVYNVTWFDRTGDRPALDAAERDLKAALEIWQGLVRLTDGLYPAEMAFGPDDVGHWKDKLPYVRHDLELVRQRARIDDCFGRFDQGFDFGDPVEKPGSGYRATRYLRQNNVAPRWLPVDPETLYSEASGYGWAAAGERKAVAIPLVPYLVVRAVQKDPAELPHDALFRDWIAGRGPQVFRVKAAAGEYSVLLLGRDEVTTLKLRPEGGVLAIPFPKGDWAVCGLVVKSSKPALSLPAIPAAMPRPRIEHQPPLLARADRPLRINVRVSPPSAAAAIRLYYRPVNQLAQFQSLENGGANGEFTIPAGHISARWDLMYYFEVLNSAKTGWFQPDPAIATPYYVVPVKTAAWR